VVAAGGSARKIPVNNEQKQSPAVPLGSAAQAGATKDPEQGRKGDEPGSAEALGTTLSAYSHSSAIEAIKKEATPTANTANGHQERS
jgi:hypothetical protein